MSCEPESESTFQEPAGQTQVTEGGLPLPDQADAPQPQRRSLPPILPESTQRLQIAQQPQGESTAAAQQQEQHQQPPQPDQQLEERAVFVIPNCPPTCVPENPGSCPQILVLPFLPTASTRSNQGITDEDILWA